MARNRTRWRCFVDALCSLRDNRNWWWWYIPHKKIMRTAILHGITSKKIFTFIFTTMRISSIAFCCTQRVVGITDRNGILTLHVSETLATSHKLLANLIWLSVSTTVWAGKKIKQ
jgi:hypothetical protein